jgi:hypothetical protein
MGSGEDQMLKLTPEVDPPFERVPVTATAQRRPSAEPPEKIFIYTVHDGDIIPPRFVTHNGETRLDQALLESQFIRMRDWGANLVAKQLAAALGIKSYSRVRLARVLLDFNRFPGTTSDSARDPLQRQSISEPFGHFLHHAEKMELLEQYDRMSDRIEEGVDGALINIGIHTYDMHNASETKRPDISIVSTPHSYFRESRLPDGLFDPIYPDMLIESTSSRILRDRISLNLERSGFRVSHNQPYPLPEGSVEVRSQVWAFFRYVKRAFEAQHPECVEDPRFSLVWTMLLNTNLRSQKGEALSGYLHRYRRPAPEDQAAFRGARSAYEQVQAFVENSDVVRQYRRSPQRPSSMAIEVRKDLLCTFDESTGRPLASTDEQRKLAGQIAVIIAGAIEIYLETDRNVS